MPGTRIDVAKVATPELFKDPLPRTLVPSLKVTVPTGVPVELVTTAVRVTACPMTVGFPLVVRTVAVFVFTT